MVNKFFKNYRVYILTSVAYMGSLLFGMTPLLAVNSMQSFTDTVIQVMIPELWAVYLP